MFRHNQHQVEEARALSETLKFAKFNVKKTSRFLNKKHEYTESLDVQDRNGSYQYTIFPPTNKKYLNKQYANLKNKSLTKYFKDACIKCNAKKIKEIYIGAEGLVFPCGWLHDRLYGFESESHNDNKKILQFMKRVGYSNVNCFQNSIQEIVSLRASRFSLESHNISINRKSDFSFSLYSETALTTVGEPISS